MERAGTSLLAAIVFERDEAPDPPLIDFIAAARRRGVRVAGLVQEHAGDGSRERRDLQVRDLVSGATLPIMQDLGPDAEGCSVDPEAIAFAAVLLGRAVATRPDLLVVNRFGRLESEGRGMLAEIGRAFVEGVPLIACVPKRYLFAWNTFSGGLDEQLPPRFEAIEAWFLAIAPVPSKGTGAGV
jgi:hypothetical protein